MAAAGASSGQGIPQIERVLVTTDLSPLGDRAIRWAFALPRRQGVVHVLHVIEPVTRPNPLYAHYTPGRAPTEAERRTQTDAIREQLRALVPDGTGRAGVTAEFEVLEQRDVVRAICETADRLGADVICIASHGRSGVSRALLGSVAERVLESSRRPVFVVRPELD